jgi:hypothetical protein
MQGDLHAEEDECLTSGLPLSLMEEGEGKDGSSRQCAMTPPGEGEENKMKQKTDNVDSDKKVMRAASS